MRGQHGTHPPGPVYVRAHDYALILHGGEHGPARGRGQIVDRPAQAACPAAAGRNGKGRARQHRQYPRLFPCPSLGPW
jgi:hypothetical protein